MKLKRVLSLLLVVVMLATLAPVSVFADAVAQTTAQTDIQTVAQTDAQTVAEDVEEEENLRAEEPTASVMATSDPSKITLNNLWVATQTYTEDEYYMIASNSGVKDITDDTSNTFTSGVYGGSNPRSSQLSGTAGAADDDQSSEAYLLHATNASHASTPATSGDNYSAKGAYYMTPQIYTSKVTATMQRGTEGAPYFSFEYDSGGNVKGSAQAIWQLKGGSNDSYSWLHVGTSGSNSYYLVWWIPENFGSSGSYEVPLYDSGTTSGTRYSSGGESNKWCNFDCLEAVGDYETALYCDPGSGYDNVYLKLSNAIYYQKAWPILMTNANKKKNWDSNATQGLLFRPYNEGEYGGTSSNRPYNYNSSVTLYKHQDECEISLNLTTAQTESDANGNIVIKNGAANTSYTLQSVLKDNLGGVSHETRINTSAFAGCKTFKGYTFGSGRMVATYEKSSDPNNAITLSGDTVKLTDNHGAATITVTYKWNETDGTTKELTDTITFVNADYKIRLEDITFDNSRWGTDYHDHPDAGNNNRIDIDSYANNNVKQLKFSVYSDVTPVILPAGLSTYLDTTNSAFNTDSSTRYNNRVCYTSTNSTLATDATTGFPTYSYGLIGGYQYGTANSTFSLKKADGTTFLTSPTVELCNKPVRVDIKIDGARDDSKTLTPTDSPTTVNLTVHFERFKATYSGYTLDCEWIISGGNTEAYSYTTTSDSAAVTFNGLPTGDVTVKLKLKHYTDGNNNNVAVDTVVEDYLNTDTVTLKYGNVVTFTTAIKEGDSNGSAITATQSNPYTLDKASGHSSQSVTAVGTSSNPTGVSLEKMSDGYWKWETSDSSVVSVPTGNRDAKSNTSTVTMTGGTKNGTAKVTATYYSAKYGDSNGVVTYKEIWVKNTANYQVTIYYKDKNHPDAAAIKSEKTSTYYAYGSTNVSISPITPPSTVTWLLDEDEPESRNVDIKSANPSVTFYYDRLVNGTGKVYLMDINGSWTEDTTASADLTKELKNKRENSSYDATAIFTGKTLINSADRNGFSADTNKTKTENGGSYSAIPVTASGFNVNLYYSRNFYTITVRCFDANSGDEISGDWGSYTKRYKDTENISAPTNVLGYAVDDNTEHPGSYSNVSFTGNRNIDFYYDKYVKVRVETYTMDTDGEYGMTYVEKTNQRSGSKYDAAEKGEYEDIPGLTRITEKTDIVLDNDESKNVIKLYYSRNQITVTVECRDINNGNSLITSYPLSVYYDGEISITSPDYSGGVSSTNTDKYALDDGTYGVAPYNVDTTDLSATTSTTLTNVTSAQTVTFYYDKLVTGTGDVQLMQSDGTYSQGTTSLTNLNNMLKDKRSGSTFDASGIYTNKSIFSSSSSKTIYITNIDKTNEANGGSITAIPVTNDGFNVTLIYDRQSYTITIKCRDINDSNSTKRTITTTVLHGADITITSPDLYTNGYKADGSSSTKYVLDDGRYGIDPTDYTATTTQTLTNVTAAQTVNFYYDRLVSAYIYTYKQNTEGVYTEAYDSTTVKNLRSGSEYDAVAAEKYGAVTGFTADTENANNVTKITLSNTAANNIIKLYYSRNKYTYYFYYMAGETQLKLDQGKAYYKSSVSMTSEYYPDGYVLADQSQRTQTISAISSTKSKNKAYFYYTADSLPNKTVVLDYGLSATVSYDDKTLEYVGTVLPYSSSEKKDIPLAVGSSAEPIYDATSAAVNNITAEISGGALTVTPPNAILGSESTVFYVSAKNVENRYRYASVTVIPATAIYYEDSASGINYSDGWTVVDDKLSAESVGELADELYGTDSAYNTVQNYSMGSAHETEVYKGSTSNASFTFTGTGFDIISRTGSDCGFVTVKVEGSGYNKTFGVDAYRGYSIGIDEDKPYVKYMWSYGDDGQWHVKRPSDYASAYETKYHGGVPCENTDIDTSKEYTGTPDPDVKDKTYVTFESNCSWTKSSGNNSYYQIPIIKIGGLDYGTYTVTITPMYSTYLVQDGAKSYKFCLDGIRIYNPMGDTGNDAYKSANEAYPQYINLRNILTSDVSSSVAKGAVIIDAKADGAVEEYKSYGANNEIYLNPGKSIAFKLETTAAPTSIQLGMKALTNSTTVDVNGTSQSITSKTDMYYNVGTSAMLTEAKDGGTVITITNAQAGSPVSITNLKVTFNTASTATVTVNSETVATAAPQARRALFAMAAPTVPVVTPFEPTISVDAPETVTVGDTVTVTVTTSDDVAYITVNGEKVETHDSFVWSYETVADKVGELSFEVKAYNEDGKEAENTASATVTVEAPTFEPTISVDAPETVTVGDTVTVTVTTSDDVAYITVNGEKVETHDSFVWSYETVADTVGELSFEVKAYSEYGVEAENTATATVTVAPLPYEPEISVDAPDTVTVGDTVTVTVTTSDDVAYITVNGEKVETHDSFVWSYETVADTVGVMSFEVKAYNTEGVEGDNVHIIDVTVEALPFEPLVNLMVPATAKVGEKITVQVVTSSDVAYITVNGAKVESHSDSFVWTYELTADSEGELDITVVAYNAEGEAAENEQTATVSVTNQVKSAWEIIVDAIKGFFKKLLGGN